MSAFLVSDKHISEMLRFASQQDGTVHHDGKALDLRVPSEAQKVGQILLDENYRSLNARYGHDPAAHDFQYEPFSLRPLMKAIEVVKLCHCYDYQTCETDDYYTSDAHTIVQAIQAQAIRSVPGYDEAEWCI